MGNDYTINAVIKALKTLKQFGPQRREMTLTELSNCCDITKSSMLRILASLEAEGFVKYDEDVKKYHLGTAIFNLANTAYGFLDIRKVAAPVLKRGVEESQLMIHLAVIENDEILVIDKIWPRDHRDAIALVSYIGGSVPVHCTGVGKVLAAYAGDKERQRLLDRCRFEKYTENTITDRGQYEKVLEEVLHKGYAFNDCEHEPYLCCITRPVLNGEGLAVAAVSMSGLKDVFTPEKLEIYNTISRKICSELSQEFGYRG